MHWRKISREPDFQGEPLGGDIEVDVCIIGGGFTGLNAALVLARGGVKAAVLEAGTIGVDGASGRANGQVIPHHTKKSPSEVVELYGKHRGDIFNAIVESGPRSVFETIERYDIKCDLTKNGWIQPAHSPVALERARLFYKDWSAFGARVEWLDKDTTRAKIGTEAYLGAWKTYDAGQINPYALTQGLARAVLSEGAAIYTQTRATAVHKEAAGWRITTPRGVVRCRVMLACTNALTGRFWPGLQSVVVPLKTYQVATKPLPPQWRARILPGGEGVSDSLRDTRAFRYDARGGLAMVGIHTLWHNAAQRGKDYVTGRLRVLFKDFPENFIEEYWEGTIGIVPDRLPRLMRLDENAYFIGIYSGRGIALSSGWGRTMAEFILGQRTEADLPIPLTGLRSVPAHPIAVKVAKYVVPFMQMRDRMEQ